MTFGIYSTPVRLGVVVADIHGTAVAHLKIPAGLVGQHTVVAAGMSPSQTIRYLEMSVLVVPAANAAEHLAVSGNDSAPLLWIGAGALLLLVLGALMLRVVSRRSA